MKISSRVEYKYPCDLDKSQKVKSILSQSPLWKYDSFCPGGNSYWVSSLYWDTREMFSYHDSISGEYTKAKLRLRAYSSQSHQAFSTLKAEVKSRVDKICDKAVASVESKHIDLTSFETCFPEDLFGFYRRRCKSYKMQPLMPVAVVLYERLGFVHLNQKSRITIDQNIIALPPHLFFQSFQFIQSNQNFESVVELKDCNQNAAEIQNITRYLSVPRQKFSKYCQAVDSLEASKIWKKKQMVAGTVTRPSLV
ncbi:MAG: VTC domain-containing protein [Bdellovibrionales bacterium]|nr:VTC domain-containing protein [Bdellovibrionales bacterium]